MTIAGAKGSDHRGAAFDPSSAPHPPQSARTCRQTLVLIRNHSSQGETGIYSCKWVYRGETNWELCDFVEQKNEWHSHLIHKTFMNRTQKGQTTTIVMGLKEHWRIQPNIRGGAKLLVGRTERVGKTPSILIYVFSSDFGQFNFPKYLLLRFLSFSPQVLFLFWGSNRPHLVWGP